MRNMRGFTVIEMLVVLAVLGALVGIVTISLGQHERNAASQALIADMQVIEIALAQYASACNGLYPADIFDPLSFGDITPNTDDRICTLLWGDYAPEGVGLFDNPPTAANDAATADIIYRPLASDSGNIRRCNGYHLAVRLPERIMSALNEDDDINSASSPLGWAVCRNTLGLNNVHVGGFDASNDAAVWLYDHMVPQFDVTTLP